MRKIKAVVKSKDKVFWEKVVEETEGTIERMENNLKFELEVLKMAKKKLKQTK